MTKERKDISNLLPTEEACSAKEDKIYCHAVLGDKNECTIYSDLTGRFPVESYDGKTTFFMITVKDLYECNKRPQKQEHDHRI